MGFIVGLITGLIIAVIVALMVTKTPIPFAGRKDNSGNTPTPATVTANNPPAGDPNQSLYGKETPKPAISAPIADNTQNIPERPMSVATPQQPVSAPEDKTVYYLQAGAFRNRSEAENMRGSLALLGFESHISEGTSNSGTMYRVRLGPYRTDSLNKIQNRLKQNGISTTVTH